MTVDPELVASDPAGVLATLNAAIVANNAITGSTRGPISSPTSSTSAFFDIEEETNALYAQANFATGIFRGNVGARYLETDITSVGNSILNGEVSLTSDTSSYDFFLPRLNLVADITDDLVIRTGWGKDVRRPNFSDLSSALPSARARIQPLTSETLG